MTQHPWESMSPQDIDKLSPTTMRETNADYFYMNCIVLHVI